MFYVAEMMEECTHDSPDFVSAYLESYHFSTFTLQRMNKARSIKILQASELISKQ